MYSIDSLLQRFDGANFSLTIFAYHIFWPYSFFFPNSSKILTPYPPNFFMFFLKQKPPKQQGLESIHDGKYINMLGGWCIEIV